MFNHDRFYLGRFAQICDLCTKALTSGLFDESGDADLMTNKERQEALSNRIDAFGLWHRDGHDYDVAAIQDDIHSLWGKQTNVAVRKFRKALDDLETAYINAITRYKADARKAVTA